MCPPGLGMAARYSVDQFVYPNVGRRGEGIDIFCKRCMAVSFTAGFPTL